MIEQIDYLYIDGEKEYTYVFLHGWGVNKNAFDMVVQSMNNHHAKLILDFLGFGKSGMPREYYDTYEYAYQVFLLLIKLDIKNVVLIGHSFGGRVSIILSSIFGIKIKCLVLTSSAGLNKFEIKKQLKIMFYKIKKYLVRLHVLPACILKNSGSADYRKLCDTMRSVFVRVVNQDLGYLCHLIQSKTILVWDKKDAETGFWIAKKLNSLIRHSRIYLCSGGHFCYLYNYYRFAIILDNICIY